MALSVSLYITRSSLDKNKSHGKYERKRQRERERDRDRETKRQRERDTTLPQRLISNPKRKSERIHPENISNAPIKHMDKGNKKEKERERETEKKITINKTHIRLLFIEALGFLISARFFSLKKAAYSILTSY